MNSILSDSTLRDARELARRYADAAPFRHLVLDDFFQPDFCAQLVDTFPPFDDRLAMDENGRIGGKCTHENLPALKGVWQRVDELIQTEEFRAWLGEITGIEGLLYDPHYFGGGTHENRHGQDLDPHVDFNRHPFTGWHRRLNLIVYLNPEWQPEWGGAIEFHKDPRRALVDSEVTLVQPVFNRAVLFETTHWSWHGFERINLPEGSADSRSRKSLALYFYSENRPPEEQVGRHSTIYVERPLPARIKPGSNLSEADHAEILRLLARRDQHLQRLYGQIAELYQALDERNQSPPLTTYRLIRALGGRILRYLGLRR